MRDASVLIETLRLAPIADRDALARAWAQADAAALVHAAVREGVAPWLARRLKTLQINLAGDAALELAGTAKRGIAQSLRVDAETVATLDALAEEGIQAIPLKAAAMRSLASRVPYADARTPSDVDVLVREADAPRAFDALCARGYSMPRASALAGHHHLPALAGALGIGVELHLSTSAAIAPAEAWRRATHGGATATIGHTTRVIPSDTELLWHAASHAVADTDDYARIGTRLRYWLDVSALLAAHADIDWPRVRARLQSNEVRDANAVRAWLRTAAWLAGVTLRDDALGGQGSARLDVERMMHWRLRVHARHADDSRWAERLVEEGARGEAGLPVERGRAPAPIHARVRHALAATAARVCWVVQR